MNRGLAKSTVPADTRLSILGDGEGILLTNENGSSNAAPLLAVAHKSLRIVIDAVGIRGGGGATVLEGFLESLPRIRPKWKITTFILPENCRDFRLSVDCDSVRVIESNCGDSGLGRLIWQNVALPLRLRRARADVVFSLTNSGAVLPAFPQVVYLHQPNPFRRGMSFGLGHPERLRYWGIGMIANWSGWRSHAVIVQTETMKAAVKECYPSLGERLVVIPSGIRDVQPSTCSQARIRQFLGEETGPVISYVSLPAAHKNHATLLAAWPLVRGCVPGARLVLTLGRHVSAPDRSVNGGTSVAGYSLHDLPIGVIDLGVLSQQDVRSLYRCSDIMVFPSVAESFGLPLVEAMAEGCPVAASDLPYAHEILGEAGVYFDPYSPTSIAATIKGLLCDHRQREQLIQLGLERCRGYKADVIAEKVAQVLEAAAASG